MTIRKLAGVVPVIAVLALAGPVASANAQSPADIPCYPWPAFCGPNGKPWIPLLPLEFPSSLTEAHFPAGPVQLPPGFSFRP